MAALLGVTVAGADPSPWPGFLPRPASYAPAVAATIQRAWANPTLHRTVEGPPAPMPLSSYLALIDEPEVIAAAARHLGLAEYTVRELGEDWYAADDNDGAQGTYLVLDRRGGRRVTVSWGERRGRILGAISGSALSIMQFEPRGDETLQSLEVYVVIDNAIAAQLARSLVAVFGRIADRKLVEGFAVSAKIAAWAKDRPDEFCGWLARQPLDEARRGRLSAALCAAAPPSQPARAVAR